MPTQREQPGERVELAVDAPEVASEVVLAYRRDGELHELASMEPPARVVLRRE